MSLVSSFLDETRMSTASSHVEIFEIDFDRNPAVYREGDYVTGKVNVSLNEDLKLRSKFIGGRCKIRATEKDPAGVAPSSPGHTERGSSCACVIQLGDHINSRLICRADDLRSVLRNATTPRCHAATPQTATSVL